MLDGTVDLGDASIMVQKNMWKVSIEREGERYHRKKCRRFG